MQKKIPITVGLLMIAALAACAESTDSDVEEAAADIDLAAIPVSDADCGVLSGWVPAGQPGQGIADPVRNEIVIAADGEIRWNGETISAETLEQYLDIVESMAPTPETMLALNGEEPCADVEEVAGRVSSRIDCTTGHCVYSIGDEDDDPEPDPAG